MTGREADPELRRSANSLLRKNGNDLDKALVAYCKYLLDDATTLRPLGAIKGGWDTAHEPCVYVGHADLLQHTTRGCIDFLGKADDVVDPCGIEHPIEKSGCTFTCVPLTPKVAPNYETKLQLTGWRPDCEASAPYEGAIVQTDLPLGVSTRSMLGNEVCELFYYDLARPWPAVSEEVAHDLRVAVQFDQKIEIAVHKRRER